MNNNYLTVSEINKYIKSKFDNDPDLGLVYLKGEISNFKFHTTGHLYFTIKDENSRILAVMFNNNAKNLKFVPRDGDKVLVIGRINVYEANGNYQIYIQEMVQDGIGNLYLEYEKLKKKLQALGYFNQEHKKPIPKFPKKIGIITASTGAAVHDIMTTIDRRYGLAELYIFPCLVQGTDAKFSIVESIKEANKYNLDVIILGRGGGSIEDLWSFNEEVVANAIYESNTPIISAVGHEVDFTISDFVSDLRAPTPTAAAELAVPNVYELRKEINNYKIRASQIIVNLIRQNASVLNNLVNSYALKNPTNIYEIKTQKLDYIISKMLDVVDHKLEISKNKYLNIISKLETLNPILTLKRGYAIVEKDGNPVSNIDKLKKSDLIRIELNNGFINSQIIEVEKR